MRSVQYHLPGLINMKSYDRCAHVVVRPSVYSYVLHLPAYVAYDVHKFPSHDLVNLVDLANLLLSLSKLVLL